MMDLLERLAGLWQNVEGRSRADARERRLLKGLEKITEEELAAEALALFCQTKNYPLFGEQNLDLAHLILRERQRIMEKSINFHENQSMDQILVRKFFSVDSLSEEAATEIIEAALRLCWFGKHGRIIHEHFNSSQIKDFERAIQRVGDWHSRVMARLSLSTALMGLAVTPEDQQKFYGFVDALINVTYMFSVGKKYASKSQAHKIPMQFQAFIFVQNTVYGNSEAAVRTRTKWQLLARAPRR